MAAASRYFWLAMALFVFTEGVIFQAQAWSEGHATYYGGSDASGTNNGACGYSNVFALGYGVMTAALSAPLFQNGVACGACFQIMCTGSPSCYGNSIVVTATNLCPQGSFGGWCDSPKYHFDLSQPAFGQIAAPSAGNIGLQYQQVSCSRSGGIKFAVQGHTYFMQVLVYNVAGAGDVTAVSVKGANTGWVALSRSWGQIWQTPSVFDGQPLSFAATTGNGASITSFNVAGQFWQYGQTFEGSQF